MKWVGEMVQWKDKVTVEMMAEKQVEPTVSWTVVQKVVHWVGEQAFLMVSLLV